MLLVGTQLPLFSLRERLKGQHIKRAIPPPAGVGTSERLVYLFDNYAFDTLLFLQENMRFCKNLHYYYLVKARGRRINSRSISRCKLSRLPRRG